MEQTATDSPPETMAERHILNDLAPKSKDDEELLKFIEESKPNIYVVGAGGSGSRSRRFDTSSATGVPAKSSFSC